MPLLVDHIEFLSVESVPVDLQQGRCVLATTTGLFNLGGLPSKCYAVLASWLDPSISTGMFVNVVWGKEHRGVHSVAAASGFRGLRHEDQRTLPVVIGSWLFETRRLTIHSADRTDAGERWARAVGGVIPDRDQRGTETEAMVSGRAGVAMLNEVDWPADVARLLHG